MAADANVFPPEYVHLVLTIMGAACSIFFGLVSWIVRVAFKRAVAKALDIDNGLEKLSTEFGEFKHRTSLALALAGITDADGNPSGKRLGH